MLDYYKPNNVPCLLCRFGTDALGQQIITYAVDPRSLQFSSVQRIGFLFEDNNYLTVFKGAHPLHTFVWIIKTSDLDIR